MKIYTKTGDKGTCALFGGTRVPKSDIRIEAYGTVDELNSWIGVLRTKSTMASDTKILQRIQEALFVIGAHLATDPSKSKLKKPELDPEVTSMLETEIDKMQEKLKPLTSFILPGVNERDALSQVARSICRRAERSIVHLAGEAEVDGAVIAFINRLSDYLFVMARKWTMEDGGSEISWQP